MSNQQYNEDDVNNTDQHIDSRNPMSSFDAPEIHDCGYESVREWDGDMYYCRDGCSKPWPKRRRPRG